LSASHCAECGTEYSVAERNAQLKSLTHILKGSIPGPAQAKAWQAGQLPVHQQPKVVMYATSWCPYCAKAREFFKRNDVVYTEYDVERKQYRDREYKSMGGRGGPYLLIVGDAIGGFNEPALRHLLEPRLKQKT
jgi:glutaredoxin